MTPRTSVGQTVSQQRESWPFWLWAIALSHVLSGSAWAQSSLPTGDKDPVLRLEADGPTGFVTSLAFSKDGKTLYAAGYDKVVRLWNLDARSNRFQTEPLAYRVPINPGLDGAINAMALSPNGTWLAVAGMGVIREGAGFRQPGLVLPIIGGMTQERWEDRGSIYVYNTKQPHIVHHLRGHRGPIYALAFAPPSPKQVNEEEAPPLVSIARERDLEKNTYKRTVWLWNVAKGTKEGWEWQVDPLARPGLAAWRTGDQPQQLMIGFAWGDERLHIWDVEHDKTFDLDEKGKANNSLTSLPDRGGLLTGSFDVDSVSGRLNVWQFAPGGEPRRVLDLGKALVAKEITYYLPRALTLFSSRADGKLDHVAVVLRAKHGDEEEYGLYACALADFRTVIDWLPLWKGGGDQPVIAAAPEGRHLAVAGNAHHQIALFSIADLLGKKREPVQRLQSVGTTFRFVSFVKQGDSLGLLLNERTDKAPGALPRPPRADDWVFDFVKRKGSLAQAGAWQSAFASLDGWSVKHIAAQEDRQGKKMPAVLAIFKDGQEQSRLPLKANQTVTDFALLPPRPPLQVPLLALASVDEFFQPSLELYNAATGDLLRQLNGHTDPIRCLAFSADGRLLASVADDQTACVWSLTTLNRSLGVRGMLKGVAIEGIPAVARVDPNSPGQGRLHADDRIEGIVEESGLRPVRSVQALIEALSRVQSGKEVKLRLRDSSGEERTVMVAVEDGLDSRKQAVLLGLGANKALEIVNLIRSSIILSPVRGVAFKTALQVGQISPESPARDKLAHADVIEGLVINNDLQVLPTPQRFYETIELMKPKSTALLRVRGRGQVAIEVGQAVYEWKPLLTLFVTRPSAASEREWIGWNPNGQYESSAPKADSLIGWHFNTGDPRQPTRFAAASEYRKEYYREGILELLVASGSLSPALKKWEDENKRKPLPEPKMTLWLDELDPKADQSGPVLVRQRQLTLKLAVDDFPLERIAALSWQFDRQAPQRFDDVAGTVHRADLSKAPWKKGEQRIRIVLRTQEEQPREYIKDLTLRYQSPPPAVRSNIEQRRLIVNRPVFNLVATVEPGDKGQLVQVNWYHRHNNKVLQGILPQRELEVDRRFELQPGDNLIAVVAVNKDALTGFEEFETDRQAWLVTYTAPATAPPPRIAVDKIQAVPDAAGPGPVQEIRPGRPIIVSSSRIRLLGRIEASELLAKAELQLRDGAPGKSLTRFESDKNKTFEINEELALQPGPQRVHLLAKSATSSISTTDVNIEYHPPLPKLVVISPPPGLTLYEGEDNPEITVEAQLLPPADRREFQASLLVNGRDVADRKPEIDQQAQTLTAKASLAHGENHLQVRLANAWTQAAISDDLLVRFLRPPRIIKIDGPEKTKASLIDVSARVESALALTSAVATVNGQEIATVELVPPNKTKDKGAWTIHLANIALQPGKNEVRLWASNAETRCRQPGALDIVFEPPAKPLPPAEIEMIAPRTDTRVTNPELAVRFRVKSASALKRVQLVRESGESIRKVFDVSRLEADAQGAYEFKTELSLETKANRVWIEAVTDEGAVSTSVVVNFVRVPVLLEIDGIVTGQGTVIRPERLRDGILSFPKLPSGWVKLKGHITLSKGNEDQFRAVRWAKICVNGFQQMQAPLDPPVDHQRTFTRDILLNRTENRIEISLPELKQDTSSRREFTLECLKPAPIHKVHVLIVGIGEKDARNLTDRVLEALHARSTGEDTFTTPLFGEGQQVEGQLYGPLTVDVNPGRIYGQLLRIQGTLERLARAGAVNDVVLVYYVGAESVSPDGHFFLTDSSTRDKVLTRSAVECDGLVRRFNETLGAHLLFLDVTRPAVGSVPVAAEGQDRIAKWRHIPHLGVFRYAWRDTENHPKNDWLITDVQAAIATEVPTLGLFATYLLDLLPGHPQNLAYDRALPGPLADLKFVLVQSKQ